MRVALAATQDSVAPGRPEATLALRGVGALLNTANRYPFALGPRGVGFLAMQAAESSTENPLVVVLNWRTLLRPRLPAN